MANPQKENGHTQIANEVMEALGKIRIPGEARQVLDVIIRKTWGWNKKNDPISLSQFCLATSMKKDKIIRARNKLQKMNLIYVSQKGNDLCLSYCFNKDFDTWKPFPKKETFPKKEMIVSQKGNASYPKKEPTKDTTTKDTITKDKDIRSSFDERFWPVWKKRVNKVGAFKAWKALKPSEELINVIVADVIRRMELEDWVKEGRQFCPNPQAYLNGRRWEDEVPPPSSVSNGGKNKQLQAAPNLPMAKDILRDKGMDDELVLIDPQEVRDMIRGIGKKDKDIPF